MTRVLQMAGGDAAPAEKLGPLRLFLIAHIGFETLSAVRWPLIGIGFEASTMAGLRMLTGVSISLAIALCLIMYGLRPGARRTLAQVVTFLGAASIYWHFPAVANHFFLAVFCLLVISMVDLDKEREALAGLQTLRWIAASMLFFSGLQKILYGTYFRAEFLTWAIAHTDRFAALFGWFLPAAELERIQALPTLGPFYSEWWPMILLSNSVWILELCLPFLLMHPKTRNAATLVVVAFLVGIEAGAREWFFAFIFLPLLLLFPRRNLVSKVVPVFLTLYALVIVLWLIDQVAGTSFVQLLGKS